MNGFGTPEAVYLLYLVKLVVFALGGFLLISATTSGLGGLGDFADWWTEPIVFQKVGRLDGALGGARARLPDRCRSPSASLPLIGGILYWLRPGTVRLPPWPDRVPLTGGTRRTPVDVALYAGVLASAVYLLLSDGEPAAGTAAGRLDPAAVALLLGFLGLLGLRDKVAVPRRARRRSTGPLLIVFLFPLTNLIVAAQIVFVCIWWGAASSKLNRHFPFVVSVMISNTPWNRSRKAKALLYTRVPRGPAPRLAGGGRGPPRHGDRVHAAAHPACLSSGGVIGTIAVIGMIIFHVHITLDVPARGAAGVEPVHDLRDPVPLRPLRRRAAVDPRRPAADRDPRGDLRRDPGARQLPPRHGLVPALDALLRRQLGDEPVAASARTAGRRRSSTARSPRRRRS